MGFLTARHTLAPPATERSRCRHNASPKIQISNRGCMACEDISVVAKNLRTAKRCLTCRALELLFQFCCGCSYYCANYCKTSYWIILRSMHRKVMTMCKCSSYYYCETSSIVRRFARVKQGINLK
ncbi:hypothetical protein F442_02124 [Phytophthora nicotianae P10297]|uniref:Uncharacterized protein n=5 Tax=Phytophthora nicotianae TaxID=4792 RepID=W2PDZ8_PHYN3|nr:hypothetical protein PPTG_24544 [Phytophthora nicotianae INRA-310]ETI55144.1 hypothetical protein F443_02166 [Phytophthora nicotianae P1569]ETM54657.1 hypothetical protein L914_02052 [Phytophthora nicotianae]ETO83884.1 hypothetical protein F444_02174 [Phytophthora nicotianae P1976]ETP52947.1 hypothetical protein F442_02124 [Phytophthora nicotianae P10297]ETM98860.1 hypothetical protein PPTG_24544 [Phytophthora nicotianae INRA-310]